MKLCYYTDDILEVCNMKHLTVDEIFSLIKKKYPKAGRSSIYRNVESLVKDGLLTKVIGTGSKAVFEKTISPHVHFIDKKSDKVFDIDMSEINFCILSDKYKIDEIDIKVYGEKLDR